MIKLLARRVETLPVLALVTFRDDQLRPVAPLQIVLGELAGAPAVERRHVPPLSLEAVRTLAGASGAGAERLFERTGGNPFFVTEALAAMNVQMPDTVRWAVLARAAHLPAAARRLLEAVAVVPSRVELWLVQATAGYCLVGPGPRPRRRRVYPPRADALPCAGACIASTTGRPAAAVAAAADCRHEGGFAPVSSKTLQGPIPFPDL
ncbi:MAG: hypothetical protein JO286_02535, partial [Solirubrobacterales bacterium]|nr:hypothetical protein [Solirubrobacterales bacterium]